MPLDRNVIAANGRETARLKALVGRLGDAELNRALSPEWTVVAALVHLAFWDLRATKIIERVEAGGPAPSAYDGQVMNDTILALAGSIAPRAAARLAVEAAETVDRRVEALSDRVLATLEAAGPPFSLGRHAHRKEHLDDIERLFPA